MRAILAENGGILRDVNSPTIQSSDDVLVAIKAAAVCRTDLYALDGTIPVPSQRIIGHEATGRITAVGTEAKQWRPGDRVALNPYLGDAGFLGLEADGAFADEIVIAASQLLKLPDEVSYPIGTFIEPVAAGMAILDENIGIPRADSILVYGDGRIAALTGALLRDGGYSDVEISLNPNRSVDAVIETAGVSGDYSAVIKALRPGGKLVLKSRDPAEIELPLLDLVKKEIRVVGAYLGNFAKAVEFVHRHANYLSSLVDMSWRIENFQQAFRAARESEDKKVVFRLNDDF